MFHSNIGRLHQIRFSMRAGAFLIAFGLPFLLPDARLLGVQQPANFDGLWDGEYVNNKTPKSGKGQYHFHPEKDGRFKVTVTWWDEETKKTNEMKLVAERLGPDAVRMTGEYKDKTYRYVGSLEGNELVLNYRELDAKGKMSSFGVSRLTRQPKK